MNIRKLRKKLEKADMAVIDGVFDLVLTENEMITPNGRSFIWPCQKRIHRSEMGSCMPSWRR